MPESHLPPLEFPIPIVTKREGEDVELTGLVIAARGAGYDTVVICTQRDLKSEIARTRVGEWTAWLTHPFVVEGEKQDGTFRFKTVELSADAGRLKLYRSQVMLADGYTEPLELASELSARFGPYLENASVLPYVWGIADLDTCLQEADYHAQWITRAGRYLLEEQDYSLLYTHIHLFDYINHHFLPMVDPACPGYNESKAEEGWYAYREAYKTADRLFATLLADSPDDTAVIVVSDHAAIPQVKATDIYRLLIDRGYMVLKDGSNTFDPNEDAHKIDMDRSKVFVTPVRSYELFVNATEGTDEYRRIQQGVLTTLRTWVDSESGRCPISIALPKEHAPLLGFWGDQCGDVVFFMEDGYVSGYSSGNPDEGDPYVWTPALFGAHHGPYLPTARTDVSSNMAFFMASGPGLKTGYRRPVDQLGYMHHTSVVPIVCHLLGIEPPAQSQGAVPRDMLEGTEVVRERDDRLPDWEWGTRVDGWGDRVWTQKRDMFEGFLPGRDF